MCCAGNSKGGHIACAVLCALAAILHAVGVGLYIWFYATVVNVIVVAAEGVDVPVETATWVGILIWPAVVFNGIALVLETIQVIFCFKASSAITAGELPTSAKVGGNA